MWASSRIFKEIIFFIFKRMSDFLPDAVYIGEGPKIRKETRMEDDKIIRLYWDRDESAIGETSKKYGAYCHAIARNILHNLQDSEECVNDTYLNAWNAIPPQKPGILSVFLGKITRNLAFDRYSFNRAEKRGGGEIDLVLDEIAQIVSDKEDPEQTVYGKELMEAVNTFLAQLPEEKRKMFVLRYWYTEKVSTIARRLGIPENTCSAQLGRTRKKLKQYLEDGGFSV